MPIYLHKPGRAQRQKGRQEHKLRRPKEQRVSLIQGVPRAVTGEPGMQCVADSMFEPSCWKDPLCPCVPFSLVELQPQRGRVVRLLYCVSVSAWSCVSTHVWMGCIHVSAGNAFAISLLAGSGNIERQQLCLPWPVGPSSMYLPQKVRMQIRSKKPWSEDF